MNKNLSMQSMMSLLKAVAEQSRLRILTLLSHGDLTTADIMNILALSRQRLTRHLHVLQEANLVDCYQEGKWSYFCLSNQVVQFELVNWVMHRLDQNDQMLSQDMAQLTQVKKHKQQDETAYFSTYPDSWDYLPHMPDHEHNHAVTEKMRALIGSSHFQAMLDIGTGTGRLLKLFSSLYAHGVGIDLSEDRLAIARDNLANAGITHVKLRQGDARAIDIDDERFDLVTLHQVLHFLPNPQQAICQAAKVMRPNGQLLIVDFAPHDLGFLRQECAHVHLGFSDSQIESWLTEANLRLEKTETFVPAVRKNGHEQDDSRLTIKLWLARDPRVLMA